LFSEEIFYSFLVRPLVRAAWHGDTLWQGCGDRIIFRSNDDAKTSGKMNNKYQLLK
jgi:hypothetical protein